MRRLAMVLLAVALAGVWPSYRSISNHSVTAIIGAGVSGPSTPLLVREVPDLVVTSNAGHDGQQFYAIARHPFDPTAAAPFLANPVYRYRRIMFPVLGWMLAPHGGTWLIVALSVVGLAGVALAAFALGHLPGAPWWLPVVVGVSPGVIAATGLTLSDSLALGLTLAALAAAAHRRPAIVLAALVLGTLTRETVILAALALALSPGLANRWRLAYVVGPAAALGAWVLWVSHVLGIPISDGASDQVSLPMRGWLQSTTGHTDLLIGVLLAAVVVLGIIRTRDDVVVCAFLGLQLALLVTLSPNVTVSWVNSTRAVIAVVPLAAWGVARETA